jgi:hypothetical protein
VEVTREIMRKDMIKQDGKREREKEKKKIRERGCN